MTALEQQLMSELAQEKAFNTEIIERLESQEQTFIKQLQQQQKAYENNLSQIVESYKNSSRELHESYEKEQQLLSENTSKLLKNQSFIYSKLKQLSEQLQGLPNYENLNIDLEKLSNLLEK